MKLVKIRESALIYHCEDLNSAHSVIVHYKSHPSHNPLTIFRVKYVPERTRLICEFPHSEEKFNFLDIVGDMDI